MKILFLDIDGVVNCCNTRQRHRGFIGIDPVMAFIVGKIQLYTDCKIVLSSSWRHFPDGKEEVIRQVGELYGVTPTLQGQLRGAEIEAWLAQHPEVTRYAILDDDSDMLEHQLPNFFKTSWKVGITDEIAEKIIDHLNK